MGKNAYKNNRGHLIADTSFIGMEPYIKGKVRDVYEAGDKLVFIATDRISAFDVVFRELIPNKGKVLNCISAFWFNKTSDIIGNHMLTTDVSQFPESFRPFREKLEGRSMLVARAEMLPVECVVRGYLEGSGYREYIAGGSIGGVKLPAGLKQCDRLAEPVFTPTTKENAGHDVGISFNTFSNMIGAELAVKIRDISLKLYNMASEYSFSRGIILADTKFEYGLIKGEPVIADELFTPDSSRFWDLNDYAPGRPQKSYDKQFLREYLDSTAWDKNPPPPAIPDDVVAKTGAKYLEAYEIITGSRLV